MVRTKKQVFENIEALEKHLMENYSFVQVVKELAKLKFNMQNQPKTSNAKITLSKEEFDKFFHIKESKGRGRKKKVENENKGE